MRIPFCSQRDTDLLWILTRNQVTLQYKRTWLGILWSLLNPLLLAFIFYIAFTIVLKFKNEEFSLFLLAGLFPWTWFSNSVGTSAVSLEANKSLIKKFPFPRHFLLTSVILSESVHFLFSLPILTLLAYYYGKVPGLLWIAGIPILFLIEFVITLGVSFAVSIINVHFRDFQFIVNFSLNLLFWLTPILYQFETIPPSYRFLFIYFNPLAPLILSWRDLFLSNSLHLPWLVIAVLGSLIVFTAGLLLFNKLGKRIDEVL